MPEPRLVGLENVRRRPAMYFGSTDATGLAAVLEELVGNAVDQHLAGRCGGIEGSRACEGARGGLSGEGGPGGRVRPPPLSIDVALDTEGGVTVTDDGPGIGAIGGLPLVERALTELCFEPGSAGPRPRTYLGVHGVGLAAVCAVASRMEVETRERGRLWRIVLSEGRVVKPLADVGPASEVGTRIRFVPDPGIFPGATLDVAVLRERLAVVAALLPGLLLRLVDERDGRVDHWCTLEGIRALLPDGERRPREPLRARFDTHDASGDVVFSWAAAGRIRSFVNLRETPGGGPHVAGLLEGMHALARLVGARSPGRVARALARRLVGVVAINLSEPRLAGPRGERLDNPEVEPLVRAAVASCLTTFVRERPEEARAVVEGLAARPDHPGRISV